MFIHVYLSNCAKINGERDELEYTPSIVLSTHVIMSVNEVPDSEGVMASFLTSECLAFSLAMMYVTYTCSIV